MRMVRVLRDEGRAIETYDAYFHGFTLNSEKEGEVSYSLTYAILERVSDGAVLMIDPRYIKFMKKDWNMISMISRIGWYLKQLLPLQYISEYTEQGQRKLTIWRMWFGRSFNIQTWHTCGKEEIHRATPGQMPSVGPNHPLGEVIGNILEYFPYSKPLPK